MAAGRFIKFASGGLFGAGVGTALAILFAPQSGDTLRRNVSDRVKLAQLAGLEAQAETEAGIIARYRTKMDKPGALTEFETMTSARRAEQIRKLTLVHGPGPEATPETIGVV